MHLLSAVQFSFYFLLPEIVMSVRLALALTFNWFPQSSNGRCIPRGHRRQKMSSPPPPYHVACVSLNIVPHFGSSLGWLCLGHRNGKAWRYVPVELLRGIPKAVMAIEYLRWGGSDPKVVATSGVDKTTSCISPPKGHDVLGAFNGNPVTSCRLERAQVWTYQYIQLDSHRSIWMY